MSKEAEILDNVGKLTAEELYRAIDDGVVTFEDLQETGEFTAKKQKEVEMLHQNPPQPHPSDEPQPQNNQLSDEEMWRPTKKAGTLEAYQAYLARFPEGKHAAFAKGKIEQLNNGAQEEPIHYTPPVQRHSSGGSKYKQNSIADFVKWMKKGVRQSSGIIPKIRKDMDDGGFSKEELLSAIRYDHNLFTRQCVNELINNGLITDYELEEQCGISEEFVDCLEKEPEGATLDQSGQPEEIGKNRLSTEFYFWGIPSSGKTCAIGAILSTANARNNLNLIFEPEMCQGQKYMDNLMTAFSKDEVKKLPGRTETSNTFEIAFDLIDEKNQTQYPITMIDLAGEILEHMYLKDAGGNEPNASLENIIKLVRGGGKNRKSHFFVVECGGHIRATQIAKLPQDTLLTRALKHIERTGIFDKQTDAIYILLTKADKLQGEESLNQKANEYLNEHYDNFKRLLGKIAKENDIKKIGTIPFSLGEICFQDCCLLNPKSSEEVISKIIENSKGFKRKNKLWKLLSW